MIEILKRRFTTGDSILIRTNDAFYNGVIESFEDNCLILLTTEGNIEFISGDLIKGASVPKKVDKRNNSADQAIIKSKDEQEINKQLSNTNNEDDPIEKRDQHDLPTLTEKIESLHTVEHGCDADAELIKSFNGSCEKNNYLSKTETSESLEDKIQISDTIRKNHPEIIKEKKNDSFISSNEKSKSEEDSENGISIKTKEQTTLQTETEKRNNEIFTIDDDLKTNNDQINNRKPQLKREYGLKVVGYIDPKLLENEKGKEAKINSKSKTNKNKIKFNSLEELQQLILPELEEENKKLVPANGVIKVYFADKQFGFIQDKFGYQLWFSFNSIIEKELLILLKGSAYSANIPVLYTLSKNIKGDRAISLHKPKTVDRVIEISKKFINEEKYDFASNMLNQILDSFPENITASSLKEQIESLKTKKYSNSVKKIISRPYDQYYSTARTLNTNKNYIESLRYYLLALNNNERRETCIKDIAMLYIAMEEQEKALEFINEYEKELPKNITNYNYLENLYGSAKKFDKVIEYLDKILEQTNKKDKRKYSMYLSKKGFALIKLKNIDDARLALEEAVKIQSENIYASRLLKALDESDSEELTQVIAEAEFDSFGGGLSKHIKDVLDNYEEYYGLPAKVIDSQDFKQETLNILRNLIDTAGRARPRERAKYLLTEAKLMQLIEPEKERNIRFVLARYCNAMATNTISEGSNIDVARYYYIESFSLNETWDSVERQVEIFLMSFAFNYSDLIQATSKPNPAIKETLNIVLEGEVRETVWEGLLSMFICNRSISGKLIPILFKNDKYKDKSIVYLRNNGIEISKTQYIDDYTNLWNFAREKRQRDYSKWLASIKSIYINNDLETLTSQLYESLSNARQYWLTQLDNHRLNTISKEILDIINEYIRQSLFDDKERSFNFAKAQIIQLIQEIKEKPTKFSYEGFLPLLEQINLLLDKSFKKVLDASSPKVKISILGEASVVLNNNIVPFQICISNSSDSSPIRDIYVDIKDDENITFIKENNIHLDSVKGGANCILKLTVRVSANVIVDKATTLRVLCEYKTRNEDQKVSFEQQLSLRLYSEDEFELIENPFAPIADGGPVESKKMFYGRDEFIDTITKSILKADSKQVIIYGQKRSGKSSVLFHLKKKLEESNNTFCVLFSLGDIIENLTSATFFYKILASIQEEVENLKYKNEVVPKIDFLDFTSFNNYPNASDMFRKIIGNFRRECKNTPGWSEKKLIVMIDEFTYLYTAIRKGTTSDSIMKQWKAVTQNENSKFSVVLVGQDVVPTFKNEEYAKNAFGVIQDIRLTYLAKEDAIRLIEEPIWDIKSNSNRFIGSAVNSIIDYTSCNPYYIQIFCARLVDYMNKKKINSATEADIKEVADSFVIGDQALTADKFDNLLKAGEKFDFQEIPPDDSVKILRKIAIGSKNIGYCGREYISMDNKECEDKILKDLVNRDVLEKKEDNYKIQVRLFQEWLLKH